jgi:Atypical PilZ domain, cyclic di-GMP receptor
MSAAGDNATYEGLALEDILPFAWMSGDFSHSAALEHANEDTARALQAIAVYEDSPRSPHDEMLNLKSDSARIEAKLDLVVSLVARLVSEHTSLPEPLPMILRSRVLEWQAAPEFAGTKGETGFMTVWANPHVPLPLRLPCRLDQKVERNGYTWWRAGIEYLAPNVADGLDQVIFRHHRRQVAIARGTMVPGGRAAR